ncbi:MAG: rhamnulokinase [Anaerolineae bacterium]|nr:rhamnulokinase [Anaerolineae bacterium]
MPKFLAFDIGTSWGRAMLGVLDGDRLTLEPLHRFSNRATPVLRTLYWDILHLWDGVLAGLRQAAGADIAGIGLDTWAVDFALLDSSGALLDNPVSNRDPRTDGMIDEVLAVVPPDELYRRTGIQFMQINTLYQLYAMRLAGAPALGFADVFLSIADLLNYWLTGRKVVEFTSATCTQFYNPHLQDWDRALLARLGLPTDIYPEVVQPGAVLGPLVVPVPGLEGAPVIAVATHDTGSAVAAVPAEVERFAYISSGTWSLMGAEVREPVITSESLHYNFTNEGGVCGTYRLLKNILGMWLVQACQETWEAAGGRYDYDDMVQMAEAASPFGPVIDPYPNSPDFRAPGDIPARIRAFCRRTGQPAPETKGAVLRCIFESLALKYRQTLGQLEAVLGHAVEVVHIVGGGARNALLCQMAADAMNRPVIAGPGEATTMGNLIVQAMATGYLDSLAAGRALVRRSSDLQRYDPRPSSAWDDAYARFLAIAAREPR